MFYRIESKPGASASRQETYTPEKLRQIGSQVEVLLSRYGSLDMYRRSVERQLSLIAVQIHAEDVQLTPCSVFLLLELRGSGGMSAHLAQIAHILREVGYWKPSASVQGYSSQDVYYLGRSAQKLFDDYSHLDQQVRQLHSLLGHIKERQHLCPETTPQAIFDGLTATHNEAKELEEVHLIVEMLEQHTQSRWLGWLFNGRSKEFQHVLR